MGPNSQFKPFLYYDFELYERIQLLDSNITKWKEVLSLWGQGQEGGGSLQWRWLGGVGGGTGPGHLSQAHTAQALPAASWTASPGRKGKTTDHHEGIRAITAQVAVAGSGHPPHPSTLGPSCSPSWAPHTLCPFNSSSLTPRRGVAFLRQL